MEKNRGRTDNFPTIRRPKERLNDKTDQGRSLYYQHELGHTSRLRTIGEMASGLAHELNQPFCAMLIHLEGCLRLLKSGSYDDTKLIDKLELVAKQVERAGMIINFTKNFARKQPSHSNEVDINKIVRETAVFMEVEAIKIGAYIHLDTHQSIPTVHGDPVQIQQVIVNLIKNGLEAMANTEWKERSLTITTSLKSEKTVEVKVRDNGKGVSTGNISKIFESYFTTKPYGLGIGLSICRSIIESYGGQIHASANSDNGVTISFTLPIKQLAGQTVAMLAVSQNKFAFTSVDGDQ